MQLTAQFKGADGSLGYRRGTTYTLTMRDFRGLVLVERKDKSGRCLYGSVTAFLQNWTKLEAQA